MSTQLPYSIRVDSEIGQLRKVLVHTPDSGLGKVVPSKAQDWLFEDIIHLDSIRRKEYDYYTKLLLYFLDPDKIRGRLRAADDPANNRRFYQPDHPDFFNSDKVIELQNLLAAILFEDTLKEKLTAAVCAIENCTYRQQTELTRLSPSALAKVFITGALPDKTLIFPPIPNFIFTRDIGVIIGDHILLNKPAKKARLREALLAKYIFYHHPLFYSVSQNIIELSDTHRQFLMPDHIHNKRVTLEGGDIMVVSPNHLLIGVSERTTMEAAHQVIQILFGRGLVNKISVVIIPKKRDYMHIDTIFTQVKRNVWVMSGNFSKAAIHHENTDPVQKILESPMKETTFKVIQFYKEQTDSPLCFDNLEDLLTDISIRDLKSEEPVQFVYSGNNEFPFDSREQWTDSCNLLALKEGVILGYDRNNKTNEAFRSLGFSIVHAADLIQSLENDAITTDRINNTLILLPSAELSRARGGFHCMSMPLYRDAIR
ncbi:MAG: amidinotransferase [Chitinophagaceae bacterium]|nr:amidinotransferase [Chitinophagaceae bacterium]